MNPVLEGLMGVKDLSDKMIALDLLSGAKASVVGLATALTECSSPAVRSVLKGQLEDAVYLHEQIFEVMHKKGWYNAQNLDQQIQTEMTDAKTALELPV